MSVFRLFEIRGGKPFAEGQIWSYKVRRNEPGSTLMIQKVEEHPTIGLIFHISILDLRVRNPSAPAGYSTEMAHAPVSRRTLDESCTRLVGEDGPDQRYLEGYQEWKRAFDAGDAGVFTISVAEIVHGIEAAMNGAGGDAL